MEYFTSIEALTTPTAAPAQWGAEPDEIFGLGNKKRKAERKLRKAEKALAHGRYKKAERKLGKAIKKGAQVAENQRGALLSQIKGTEEHLNLANEAKDKFINAASPQPTLLPGVTKMDSSTLANAPSVEGSGLAMPLGGGSSEIGMGNISQPKAPDTGIPVVVHNKKPNYLLIAVVVFVLIGGFLFLLKHKK